MDLFNIAEPAGSANVRENAGEVEDTAGFLCEQQGTGTQAGYKLLWKEVSRGLNTNQRRKITTQRLSWPNIIPKIIRCLAIHSWKSDRHMSEQFCMQLSKSTPK